MIVSLGGAAGTAYARPQGQREVTPNIAARSRIGPMRASARLPRPRALEGELGRVEDVVAAGVLERDRGLGRPRRARLELVVNELDVEVLVTRREGGAHVAAILERVLVADLVRGRVVARVEIDLRLDLVGRTAEVGHELDTCGLRLDQPRAVDVDLVIADIDIALERDLLELAVVDLGAERVAAGGRRQLDVGLARREVMRHVVAHAHVIVRRGFDQIARERDLLEEVLVVLVVVAALELGREVAELESLVPGCLDVIKGGTRADVGAADLGGVRERGESESDGSH